MKSLRCPGCSHFFNGLGLKVHLQYCEKGAYLFNALDGITIKFLSKLKTVQVLIYLWKFPCSTPTVIAQELWGADYNSASGKSCRILKPLVNMGLVNNNGGKYRLTGDGESLLRAGGFNLAQ